jgi:hypothetical protein
MDFVLTLLVGSLGAFVSLVATVAIARYMVYEATCLRPKKEAKRRRKATIKEGRKAGQRTLEAIEQGELILASHREIKPNKKR